jgi:hypothetical protein
LARTIKKISFKVPKAKPWRITTPKSIPHKNKKKYTRKAKHRKKILERLDMYIGE